MGSAILMVPTAADAASSVYCSGFARCAAKGYSDGGYRAERTTSFWSQKPGTSCTNYIAFRLTHGRLAARMPGTGSAATWDDAAKAAGLKRSSAPRVGDVAWWGANRGPAGKKGHVSYVERVRSDGSIVVSEDNYAGAFTWRRVVRGKGWPNRFLRFRDSDGSPSGRLTSVASTASRRLDLRGTSSEPDRPGVPARYLVTIGGPREGSPVESFEFTTGYFEFSRWKTLATTGRTTVHLYGLNTPDTGGTDTLLGTAKVTIRP